MTDNEHHDGSDEQAIIESIYNEQILEIERLKREIHYLKWMLDNRDRTVEKQEDIIHTLQPRRDRL